jgi:hypothetical protein
MGSNLSHLLDEEVKRLNSIIEYQKKLEVNEGFYFYDRNKDFLREEPEDEQSQDNADSEGGDEIENQDTAQEPDTGEEPIGDDELGGDEGIDDLGGEDDADVFSADDAGIEGGGETEEIDVTDIVKSTDEIKGKLESLTSNLEKINQAMDRVKAIETNLSKMDSLVSKMQELSKQVELMRPPTEEERAKATAEVSYPYNVTLDDYRQGLGVKNQTELENNSKMSMLHNIMNDYNEDEVKNSFQKTFKNPFNI